MAITLSIDQKGLEAAGKWSQSVARQLPFATSQALNSVAFDGRTALNGATRSYFNAPTKFTQTAFLVQKSTKRNLEAAIYANDQSGRNRARFLRYGIQGGTRRQKGFERYFAGVSNDGTIPPGATLVPTSNVKLTAAGNVSMSTLKSIGRGLGGKARGGFFVGTPRNSTRPPGIYRRSRERLFAYFIAKPRPSYSSRFPMPDIAGKVIERRFNGYFMSSLERALATAKV
jgi:hypothetical protein